MSGQRIRYEEQNGLLVSREFLLNGDVVYLVLDKPNGTYKVLASDGKVLKQGRSINFTVLRSIARKALKKLGVELTDEVRKVIE